MKLAISGKGGVGKTTVAAVLARLLAADGRAVIAIDADPASNLAVALGVPASCRLTPIREMKELILERTDARDGAQGQYFKLNPTVSDLPEKYSCIHEGVRIMVLGGVTAGGGGCACPENVLLKALLTHLMVLRDEAVVVDMEAGLEHLGRATVSAVDALLIVVEPGRRSIETALRTRQLAGEIGLRRVLAIANKVRSPEEERLIRDGLGAMEILGCLSFDEDLTRADLQGTSVFENAPRFVECMRAVCHGLTNALRGKLAATGGADGG